MQLKKGFLSTTKNLSQDLGTHWLLHLLFSGHRFQLRGVAHDFFSQPWGKFSKKIVDGWNPASTRWGKGSLSQVHAQEWVGRTKEKNHWNHHPDYTVIFRLLGFWTARHLAGNYTEITSSLAPTGSPNIRGLANQYFTNLDFFVEICRDTLPVWGSVKISSTI